MVIIRYLYWKQSFFPVQHKPFPWNDGPIETLKWVLSEYEVSMKWVLSEY